MNEDRQFQSSVFRFCLLSSVDDVLGSKFLMIICKSKNTQDWFGYSLAPLYGGSLDILLILDMSRTTLFINLFPIVKFVKTFFSRNDALKTCYTLFCSELV